MPNYSESFKKTDINSEVSEYIWDIKTKRFKRNPHYRSDRFATRYIMWGAIILIMLVAIVWCVRWV